MVLLHPRIRVRQYTHHQEECLPIFLLGIRFLLLQGCQTSLGDRFPTNHFHKLRLKIYQPAFLCSNPFYYSLLL
nr:MAG TPA: hypothetical protein [Caudoviricetes sp.]